MKNIKLIGFAGVARSGKDSAFEALKLAHPDKTFRRYAFADPLKKELEEIVYNHFGLNIFNLTDEQKKIFRPLMVGWGAGKRFINEDYWVNRIMAEIDHANDSNVVNVITDVRYSNECLEIQNRGGVVVHLTRLSSEGKTIGPANEEEAANDIKVLKLADQRIFWQTKLNAEAPNYSLLLPEIKTIKLLKDE